MLNKVARRADPALLAQAEAELVDAATGALAARLVRQATAEENSTATLPRAQTPQAIPWTRWCRRRGWR
ncbi:hypothetical protein BJH93_15815 [Kocuria polaris]|nr:hypothetical protein [Kocuria polaris]